MWIRPAIFILCCAVCANSFGATPDDVRRAWASRLNRLNNVQIEFEKKIVLTPPSTRPITPATPNRRGGKPAKAVVPLNGEYNYRCVFRKLDNDHVMYHQRLTPESVASFSNAGRLTEVVDEKSIFINDVAVNSQEIISGAKWTNVIEGGKLPLLNKYDTAAGLRLHGESTWLDGARLAELDLVPVEQGVEAKIGGANGTTHWFTLDTENSFRIKKYRLVSKDGRLLVEIECSGWDPEVGAGLLPTRVRSSSFYYASDGKQRRSRYEEIHVLAASLGSNTAADFKAVGVMKVDPDPPMIVPPPSPSSQADKSSGPIQKRKLASVDSFLLEQQHDFGEAIAGMPVRHDFLVVNIGKNDARLRKVIPDCGCTTVRAADEIIAPGEAIAIRVEIDTSSVNGRISKQIALILDDGSQKTLVVRMNGNVTQQHGTAPVPGK